MIDANALIYELSRLCPIDFSDVEDYMGIKIDGDMLDKGDVLYVIDNTPTIDPVKHGRWIDMGDNSAPICSVCKSKALLNYESDYHKSDYCPHCGARMDEVTE